MAKVFSWKVAPSTYAYLEPEDGSYIRSRITDSTTLHQMANRVDAWSEEEYRDAFNAMKAEVNRIYGTITGDYSQYYSIASVNGGTVVLLAGRDGTDGKTAVADQYLSETDYTELIERIDEEFERYKNELLAEVDSVKAAIENSAAEDLSEAMDNLRQTREELTELRDRLSSAANKAQSALDAVHALSIFADGEIDQQMLEDILLLEGRMNEWSNTFSGKIQTLLVGYDSVSEQLGGIAIALSYHEGQISFMLENINALQDTVGTVEQTLAANSGLVRTLATWYNSSAQTYAEVVRTIDASRAAIEDMVSFYNGESTNRISTYMDGKMAEIGRRLETITDAVSGNGQSTVRIEERLNGLSGIVSTSIYRYDSMSGRVVTINESLDGLRASFERYITASEDALQAARDMRETWTQESGMIRSVTDLIIELDENGDPIYYYVDPDLPDHGDQSQWIRVYYVGNDPVDGMPIYNTKKDGTGTEYRDHVVPSYQAKMMSYVLQNSNEIDLAVMSGQVISALRLSVDETGSLIYMTADRVIIDSDVLVNSLTAKAANIGGVHIGSGMISAQTGNNKWALRGDGVLEATGAKISGTVSADSGYFKGSVSADNGYFKGKVEANEGYFHGNVSAESGYFKGSVSAENGYFKGKVEANEGYFHGNVSAESGYFKGSVSAENGYFKGKVEADEGYFHGTVSADSGYFQGNVTANSLTLGGSYGNKNLYEYIGDRISGETLDADAVTSLISGYSTSHNFLNGDLLSGYVTTQGMRDWLNIQSGLTSAYIATIINAMSGSQINTVQEFENSAGGVTHIITIGGVPYSWDTWDAGDYVLLNTDYSGITESGVAKFFVSKEGLLRANNAIIYGQIYATNGWFKGSVSATDGSFRGRVEAEEGYFKGTLCAATGSFNGAVTASSLTLGNSYGNKSLADYVGGRLQNETLNEGQVTGLISGYSSSHNFLNGDVLSGYVTTTNLINWLNTQSGLTSAYVNTIVNAMSGAQINSVDTRPNGSGGTHHTITIGGVPYEWDTWDGGDFVLINTEYSGATDAGIAKFMVSKDGLLQANNAIVHGQIYATNGWFKGSVSATNGEFRGNIYANDGYFKGSVSATNGYFKGSVSASSGAFSGNVYANNIYAKNGYFQGVISGTSTSPSKIGGDITANSLTLGSAYGNQTLGGYIDGRLEGVGGMDSGAVNALIAKAAEEGGWAAVDMGDYLELGIPVMSGTSAFTLSKTGLLIANNAVISGSVYATNGVFNGNVYAKNGEFRGTVSATNGYFNGTLCAATGTFGGKLTAASGSFNGAVTATTLKLGSQSYTEMPQSLSSGDVRNLVNQEAASHSWITSGDGYYKINNPVKNGTSSFTVTTNGLLIANNAILSGSVYATNGVFNGTVYAKEGAFSGNVYANNIYAKNGYFQGIVSGTSTSPSKIGGDITANSLTLGGAYGGQSLGSYIDGRLVGVGGMDSGAVNALIAKAAEEGGWAAVDMGDYVELGIPVFSGTSSFTVTKNGLLMANNAVISGSVYATNGVFNGNVYAKNGEFRGTVSATNGYFNGTLCAATGTFSGKLTAASGSFKGAVSATSLYVGNQTIQSLIPDADDFVLIDTAYYTGTGVNQKYTKIESNGLLTARNAVISGTVYANDGVFKGTVYANNGEFGGQLKAATGSFKGAVSATSLWLSDSITIGGTDSNAIHKNEALSAGGGNTYFHVSNAGLLTTRNANVRGTICAETGYFKGALCAATGTFSGKLTAASGSFKGAVSATSLWLDDSIQIGGGGEDENAVHIGETYTGNGTSFKVDRNGLLTAKNAQITGSISATNGHFSGIIDASDIVLGGKSLRFSNGGDNTFEIINDDIDVAFVPKTYYVTGVWKSEYYNTAAGDWISAYTMGSMSVTGTTNVTVPSYTFTIGLGSTEYYSQYTNLTITTYAWITSGTPTGVFPPAQSSCVKYVTATTSSYVSRGGATAYGNISSFSQSLKGTSNGKTYYWGYAVKVQGMSSYGSTSYQLQSSTAYVTVVANTYDMPDQFLRIGRNGIQVFLGSGFYFTAAKDSTEGPVISFAGNVGGEMKFFKLDSNGLVLQQ